MTSIHKNLLVGLTVFAGYQNNQSEVASLYQQVLESYSNCQMLLRNLIQNNFLVNTKKLFIVPYKNEKPLTNWKYFQNDNLLILLHP